MTETASSGSREETHNDDFRDELFSRPISAISQRSNVMCKSEFCDMIRKKNHRQRELVHEIIHRLHDNSRDPLQIFLTGPAGSGKTFTLKAIMETYNRYSLDHNSNNNAFIATGVTGKAAVSLGGTTVHSAFRMNLSRRIPPLYDTILLYRTALQGVEAVIIDEISMCGSNIFEAVNERLQSMIGSTELFGGLDLIACGDLKQLPPVFNSPVFSTENFSIGGPALLWQSLEYFPLTQVMRQKDEVFSSLLTKIGNGLKITEAELDKIKSRFRSRQ